MKHLYICHLIIIISDLVKSYPLSLQKAVSNFMLKPVKSSENNGLLNISNGAYVPWKSSKYSLMYC